MDRYLGKIDNEDFYVDSTNVTWYRNPRDFSYTPCFEDKTGRYIAIPLNKNGSLNNFTDNNSSMSRSLSEGEYTELKSKFPDIEWDWLITGTGEMLIGKEEAKIDDNQNSKEDDKPVKKSLPNLFSLINDEQFGHTETEDDVTKTVTRESDISVQTSERNKINDSQPLENFPKKQDSDPKKIRRIVFFYDDGTFETYEN